MQKTQQNIQQLSDLPSLSSSTSRGTYNIDWKTTAGPAMVPDTTSFWYHSWSLLALTEAETQHCGNTQHNKQRMKKQTNQQTNFWLARKQETLDTKTSLTLELTALPWWPLAEWRHPCCLETGKAVISNHLGSEPSSMKTEEQQQKPHFSFGQYWRRLKIPPFITTPPSPKQSQPVQRHRCMFTKRGRWRHNIQLPRKVKQARATYFKVMRNLKKDHHCQKQHSHRQTGNRGMVAENCWPSENVT